MAICSGGQAKKKATTGFESQFHRSLKKKYATACESTNFYCMCLLISKEGERTSPKVVGVFPAFEIVNLNFQEFAMTSANANRCLHKRKNAGKKQQQQRGKKVAGENVHVERKGAGGEAGKDIR